MLIARSVITFKGELLMKYSEGSTSISITLRRTLLNRLNELANRSGQSRNSLMVLALERFLNSGAAKIIMMKGKEEQGGGEL